MSTIRPKIATKLVFDVLSQVHEKMKIENVPDMAGL
jgi:hypothetical protein